jgi:hypothetical protein
MLDASGGARHGRLGRSDACAGVGRRAAARRRRGGRAWERQVKVHVSD